LKRYGDRPAGRAVGAIDADDIVVVVARVNGALPIRDDPVKKDPTGTAIFRGAEPSGANLKRPWRGEVCPSSGGQQKREM
jgi:hypothetical protein